MNASETIQYTYIFPPAKTLSACTLVALLVCVIILMLGIALNIAGVASLEPLEKFCWTVIVVLLAGLVLVLLPQMILAALYRYFRKTRKIKLEPEHFVPPHLRFRKSVRIPYTEIHKLRLSILDNQEIVLLVSTLDQGEIVLHARGFDERDIQSFGWKPFLSFANELRTRVRQSVRQGSAQVTASRPSTNSHNKGAQEHAMPPPIIRFRYQASCFLIIFQILLKAGIIIALGYSPLSQALDSGGFGFLALAPISSYIDLFSRLSLMSIVLHTFFQDIKRWRAPMKYVELDETGLLAPLAPGHAPLHIPYAAIQELVVCYAWQIKNSFSRTMTLCWWNEDGEIEYGELSGLFFRKQEAFERFVYLLCYRGATAPPLSLSEQNDDPLSLILRRHFPISSSLPSAT